MLFLPETTGGAGAQNEAVNQEGELQKTGDPWGAGRRGGPRLQLCASPGSQLSPAAPGLRDAGLGHTRGLHGAGRGTGLHSAQQRRPELRADRAAASPKRASAEALGWSRARSGRREGAENAKPSGRERSPGPGALSPGGRPGWAASREHDLLTGARNTLPRTRNRLTSKGRGVKTRPHLAARDPVRTARRLSLPVPLSPFVAWE